MTPLTVTAAPREGGQTVTVTEPVDAGLQRRYRITAADAKPAVAYDTVTASGDGWQAFPANGQVSGAQGQAITVADCTTSGANARKVGDAVLPAPTPAAGS